MAKKKSTRRRKGRHAHVPLREQVRELIAVTGMSQSELARRSEVSLANINHYLHERSDLNGSTIDRLLEVLHSEAARKSEGKD